MNAPAKENIMKTSTHLKSVGIALLLIAGLAACDKPGPAESAGKKIDQTANDAGKAIGNATDKVGDKISNATEKVGDKMSEQSAKTGVAIDDAEITAKIKGSIFAEPGLKTLQISVDTVNGVVTLTGSADSQASSDRVRSLAAAVAGVKQVDNRLALK
jgi:osmotically-inducible protein OsmY